MCAHARGCALAGVGGLVSSVPEKLSVRPLSSASTSRCMESLVTAKSHISRFVARVSIRPHLPERPHSAHTAGLAPRVPSSRHPCICGDRPLSKQIPSGTRTSGEAALGATWDISRANPQPQGHPVPGKLWGAGTSWGQGAPAVVGGREGTPALPSEVALGMNTVLTVFPEHPGLKETGP